MSKLDTVKGTLAFGSRTVVPEDLRMEADKMKCSGRFDEGVQLHALIDGVTSSSKVEKLEDELADMKEELDESESDLRDAREEVEEAIRRLDRLKERMLEKLEALGDVVPAKRLDALGDEMRDGFSDAMKPLYDV